MNSERYRARGVSPQKEDVHAALRDADRGLFPQAFCKLMPDVLGRDAGQVLAMHADGAGTKAALAYVAWREWGDAAVFRGIAQDALVMNIDDLLCVGATGPFLLSNTIGRNARLVPGEVLGALLAGYDDACAAYAGWGLAVHATGGETADVGDLVRTLIVDATVTTRLPRDAVVSNADVKPGDVIIGLASDGQAAWEREPNSGIGSNGLTSARHDLLHADYARRYPESCEPELPAHLRYCGPYHLHDPLPGSTLSVGRALLSPTRSYAPLLKPLLDGRRGLISALVHCTGGGQTKCRHAGRGVHYVKDSPFPPPALFHAIREVTGTPWAELYQVFNMGHRMEVIGDAALLPALEELGREHHIAVRQVGHCEANTDPARNRVTITAPDGELVTYE
ncbi:MAG: phosphoribosylformylglycinamidine cyclo-ligase [Candidatus Lambdaproteobacteria bacterium]|nr:phosphoribosylformylglycinamidine cyclo-ligase [Candidatus Lambdaproteobacteria bacterium]